MQNAKCMSNDFQKRTSYDCRAQGKKQMISVSVQVDAQGCKELVVEVDVDGGQLVQSQEVNRWTAVIFSFSSTGLLSARKTALQFKVAKHVRNSDMFYENEVGVQTKPRFVDKVAILSMNHM